MNLSAAIDEAFRKSELPIKVDIIDWSRTDSDFRKLIEQHYAIIQSKSKGSSLDIKAIQ